LNLILKIQKNKASLQNKTMKKRNSQKTEF
jgi:hypothetical protein